MCLWRKVMVWAVEGYHGSSLDGPVTGVSVTIGGGVGGSASISGPGSGTYVIPLGSVLGR